MPSASHIYWVKQDRPLFRKPYWTVRLGKLLTGMYDERQLAVDDAIVEAERTSRLGRQTEVWVDDGHGFRPRRTRKTTARKDLTRKTT